MYAMTITVVARAYEEDANFEYWTIGWSKTQIKHVKECNRSYKCKVMVFTQ